MAGRLKLSLQLTYLVSPLLLLVLLLVLRLWTLSIQHIFACTCMCHHLILRHSLYPRASFAHWPSSLCFACLSCTRFYTMRLLFAACCCCYSSECCCCCGFCCFFCMQWVKLSVTGSLLLHYFFCASCSLCMPLPFKWQHFLLVQLRSVTETAAIACMLLLFL